MTGENEDNSGLPIWTQRRTQEIEVRKAAQRQAEILNNNNSETVGIAAKMGTVPTFSKTHNPKEEK